jgi:hypothetical protein
LYRTLSVLTELDGLEVLLQLAASHHTCDLSVHFGAINVLSQAKLQETGTVLGALTKLTSLTFSTVGKVDSLPRMQLVQQLKKLPSLVELSLSFEVDWIIDVDRNLDACGMLQLSTLTGLTKLKVADYVGAGLNDFVASAVAVSLTRLQELALTTSWHHLVSCASRCAVY